jgi:hypothetical protein
VPFRAPRTRPITFIGDPRRTARNGVSGWSLPVGWLGAVARPEPT